MSHPSNPITSASSTSETVGVSSKTNSSASMSDDISEQTYKRLRSAFESGLTKGYDWRLRQLKGLLAFCKKEHDSIIQACILDLPKHRIEATLTEMAPSCLALRHSI